MYTFPAEYEELSGVFRPRAEAAATDFAYTDGAAFEAQIERVIAAASDRSLFSREIAASIWDWRSACHLSPVRANIMRPFEAILRHGRVLELGSGCGIISRYLGETGGEIVALEASPDRARVTALRTADLSNVRVVCDRIERFESSGKFDVVTLIGVLQYARMYSNCGPRAEVDLLRNAIRQLDDDGVLVIAIQNRLGLKYFAGFVEPNVELPYFGIEDRYGPETIVRFSLREIVDQLRSLGLTNHEVLLPLPDYHMPVSILAGAGAVPHPKFSGRTLIELAVGRDRARPDWTPPFFSLERASATIHQSGLATELANSFLIVAGKTDRSLEFLRSPSPLAWHFSVERHPAFATVKRFALDNGEVVVDRQRLTPQPPPPVPVDQRMEEDEAYISGRLWWESLVAIVNSPGWCAADIGQWARPWVELLCEQSGLGAAAALSLDKEVPGEFFDMTPLNCVEGPDGNLRFFDLEWEIRSTLTLSFLVLRGMFGSLASVASCARPADGVPLEILALLREALSSQGIGITHDQVERYIAQESSIQHWINKGADGAISQEWETYVRTAKLVVRADPLELRRRISELEARADEAVIDARKLDERLRLAQNLLAEKEALLAQQDRTPAARAARLIKRILGRS